MPIMSFTVKEAMLYKCAEMILFDECPPERKYYLCMVSEDCTGDCTLCWCNYLMGIGAGTIGPWKAERRARAWARS